MAFIFLQSALPADLSSQESGVIVDLIMRFFESILPVERESVVFAVRKGAHFTEYLILGAVLVQAVKEWNSESKLSGSSSVAGAAPDPKKRGVTSDPRMLAAGGALAAWLIGTAYAVTDEFHQSFVPGRSCELRDVMIDSCGVLTGVLLVTLVEWIRRAKEQRQGEAGGVPAAESSRGRRE